MAATGDKNTFAGPECVRTYVHAVSWQAAMPVVLIEPYVDMNNLRDRLHPDSWNIPSRGVVKLRIRNEAASLRGTISTYPGTSDRPRCTCHAYSYGCFKLTVLDCGGIVATVGSALLAIPNSNSQNISPLLVSLESDALKYGSWLLSFCRAEFYLRTTRMRSA